MPRTHSIFRQSNLRKYLFFITFSLLFTPSVSFALTPIARFDVVPHQRINKSETFNLGVIAFSKAGIDRVDFTITGQGYSGANPLQSSSMTYNPRTDVYEYWVPLKADDFSTDGVFYVQTTAYGKDGGSRNIGTFPLIVNATGNLAQPKAWVSPTGNDTTGIANNSSQPFRTIGGATNAIQAINGGSADGGIVYLQDGTYSLVGSPPITTNEWLTITRDPNANKENTIINEAGSVRYTNKLKVEGVTIQSQGDSQYVFIDSNPTNLWVNDCRIIGSGRWISNSNPIHHSTEYHYSTNNYLHDSDFAFRNAALVRGVTIDGLGNDAFQNTPLIVNCVTKDVDPGPTGWHADAYQVHTVGVPPPNNRIIYNYHASDLHIEGIFMRSDAGPATDNAFVNVLIEMREPSVPNESDVHAFSAMEMYNTWDHLVMWNCTFPYSNANVSNGAINSSIIGNVFWHYIDTSVEIGETNPLFARYGNAENNDFLYNHYMYVYGVTEECTPTSAMVAKGHPCPHWYAKSPDSHQTGSLTTGGNVLNMTDPASHSYCAPFIDSVLVDRIPFPTVPADVFGNPRIGNPDVGAIESISLQNVYAPINFSGKTLTQ